MLTDHDDAAPLHPPESNPLRRFRFRTRSPADAVCWAVAEHLGVPVASISLAQRLEEDLVIGGLGRVLIGLELQALEGHPLPLEKVWELRTVEDLVDLVADAREA